MRILIIEDNVAIGNAMSEQLTSEGYAVDWVDCLEIAEDHLASADYAMILLDLMLPDGFGIDALKTWRQMGEAAPVIIMTALEEVSQRIAGLDAGADDYLVKPVDLLELSSRVKSVSRRYHRNPNPKLIFGEMEVDLVARKVVVGGEMVKLSLNQFAILELLASRPEQIFSKMQIQDAIYSFDADFEPNTLEAHISRMRKKLPPDAIETVHGLGYRMGPSR